MTRAATACRSVSRPARLLALAAALGTLAADAAPAAAANGFSPSSVPISGGRLFDLGVSDYDRDGVFEVFSVNHKFLGTLTEGGPGAWRNLIGPAGFSATPAYPGFEDLLHPPTPDGPGLYIWAQSRTAGEKGDPEKDPFIHVLARDVTGLPLLPEQARGVLRVPSPKVSVIASEGAEVEIRRPEGALKTEIHFEIAEQGEFVLKVKKVDLPPIEVEIDQAPLLASTFIGAYEERARSRNFTLRLVDRHGIAWTDVNRDLRTDAFVVRGGLGGGIAQFIGRVDDELLLSTPDGGFADAIEGSGLRKAGCRSRQTAAVDYNRDRRIDLFSSCKNDTPKLYRATADGRFRPISRQLNLRRATGSDYEWVDLDADRAPELLAAADSRLSVLEPAADAGAKWRVRQRVRTLNRSFSVQSTTVADYDRDGDPDVFLGAPSGNTLLVNARGRLEAVRPQSLGLPARGLSSNWVDFDNDGFLDLHSMPHGLYRQLPSGRFARTGLAASAAKALWSIGNWFDVDNDGDRDLLYANRVTDGDPRVVTRMLLNNRPGGHWLELALLGAPGNAEAIGARVRVTTAAGRTQTAWVGGAEGSRYSQGHYRLYFGLGAATSAETVSIIWPDGKRTELGDVAADQILEVSR